MDLSTRISRMVFCVRDVKYIVTNSEAEALLLEATLIKKNQPKFNVLLKDDKSFPYIKITTSNAHPQVLKFRGKPSKDESFFGPFASSRQVDVAINELQKIFKIRSCSDNYFATRKRPCLLYQIQKCSAPCTKKVSDQEYQNLVTQSLKFLSGKSKELLENMKVEMDNYSKNFEYEKAATLRDRIKAVEYVREKNSMNLTTISNCDVIAILALDDIVCVQVFIYRAGQNFGSNTYFPVNAESVEISEVLTSFLGQFYQNKKPPERILTNIELSEETAVIEDALFTLHQVKTKIVLPKNKEQKILMEMVESNAKIGLEGRAQKVHNIHDRLLEIQELFALDAPPQRIEVYDNSHIMGHCAVGAMIVSGPNGFEKNEYRKFNIRTNVSRSGGDDYQMLREVLTRRFAKLSDANRPDFLIIDGGKGHLSVVEEVISCLGLDIKYTCMSKGPNRNKGMESFHTPGNDAFTLPNDNKTMQYLQLLRDEVHNFAIKSHRHKRNISTLRAK